MKKYEKLKRPVNLGFFYGTPLNAAQKVASKTYNGIDNGFGNKQICTEYHITYDIGHHCETHYYHCTNPDTNFSVNVAVTNCGKGDWWGYQGSYGGG